MADPIRVLLSQTTFNTDGVTTVWNFSFSGGYLDQTHVKAQRRNTSTGAVTAITLTPAMFTGPYQLTLSPALAVGQELTIYRATPKEGPLVDFTDRAKLTEVSLDYSAKQAIFGVAEADDWRMVVSAVIEAVNVYKAAIATGPVASVNGRTGSVVLAKSDVSLGNADNTSDVNKPVSSAQAAAIAAVTPAWAAYTPSVNPLIGTITSYTSAGRFARIGKTVFFSISVTVTANGTGAGNLLIALPTAPFGAGIVVGRETASTGKSLTGTYSPSGVLSVLTYDNLYPGGTSYVVVMAGSYEGI